MHIVGGGLWQLFVEPWRVVELLVGPRPAPPMHWILELPLVTWLCIQSRHGLARRITALLKNLILSEKMPVLYT